MRCRIAAVIGRYIFTLIYLAIERIDGAGGEQAAGVGCAMRIFARRRQTAFTPSL